MQNDGWFSHDRAARRDPKILLMRSEYGAVGYGLYWMMVETLRETENYKYAKKHIPALCLDFVYADVAKFLSDCVNKFELFAEDEEYIWSESLLRRMKRYEDIRQKRVEAGHKGGSTSAQHSKCQANAKQMLSKSLPIRLDKIREDKKERYGDVVSLEKEKYETLCFQYGKKEVDNKIDDINNYCLSKGKRYKDYAATIRAWFKKDGVLPKSGEVKRCPNGHLYTGDVCERCI